MATWRSCNALPDKHSVELKVTWCLATVPELIRYVFWFVIYRNLTPQSHTLGNSLHK